MSPPLLLSVMLKIGWLLFYPMAVFLLFQFVILKFEMSLFDDLQAVSSLSQLVVLKGMKIFLLDQKAMAPLSELERLKIQLFLFDQKCVCPLLQLMMLKVGIILFHQVVVSPSVSQFVTLKSDLTLFDQMVVLSG